MEYLKIVLDIFSEYGHMFFISCFFGVGNFINKVRNNKLKATKFEFFSELMFALMSGYITFRLGMKMQMDVNSLAIIVAINSYCGSKFLDMLQKITVKWIAKKILLEIANQEDSKEEEKEAAK